MADHMPFVFDDGGREAAGYKGSAGDCVTRSIAIVAGLPYGDVYAALAAERGAQRASVRSGRKSASARNGINVKRKWFRDYMATLGFVWTPTMQIGQGCTVHLVAGELPRGRLVVAVSRHYTAVVDGVVRDTFDPQRRASFIDRGGATRIVERCVYGYWRLV